MNALLESLSRLIADQAWLAPFLALLAGILTSFLPCSLSTLPLIIGYVSGSGEQNPKRALFFSLLFVLGSALTFTALGAIAATAGSLIGFSSSWWYLLLGTLMVLMALQLWGIFTFIPASHLVSKTPMRGALGAFVAGILGGIFSSPCSTPVLVALLAIVAGQGNLPWGIALLLCYAIGHGILAVIAGTSVGLVRRLSASERYGRLSRILNLILGALVLLVGFYLFYLGF